MLHIKRVALIVVAVMVALLVVLTRQRKIPDVNFRIERVTLSLFDADSCVETVNPELIAEIADSLNKATPLQWNSPVFATPNTLKLKGEGNAEEYQLSFLGDYNEYRENVSFNDQIICEYRGNQYWVSERIFHELIRRGKSREKPKGSVQNGT